MLSNLLGIEGHFAIYVDKGASLVIALVIIYTIFIVGKNGFTRLIHKYSVDKDNPHVATLLTISRSAWKYLFLIIGTITILNILGLGITANSLLAAAGAGGLIVGMGAQDFIKDILNGFTIIMENQYSVGDYIEIDDLCGTVINMSLRTTRIVGDNDETISIHNSSIDAVVNYSKRPPTVMCYATIEDANQLPLALEALEEMTAAFTSPYAEEKAELLGVTNIRPYGVEVGISCLCTIGHRLDLKYKMFEDMTLALVNAGVKLASKTVAMEEE